VVSPTSSEVKYVVPVEFKSMFSTTVAPIEACDKQRQLLSWQTLFSTLQIIMELAQLLSHVPREEFVDPTPV
jgi:hypothetical protein